MEFEYDSEKSETNKTKHGIDFDFVKYIWLDVDCFTIQSANTLEARYLIFGKVNSQWYAAVYTMLGKKVRIISARRSHLKEVLRYAQD
jgi:uncharacterized DUF497 family protein